MKASEEKERREGKEQKAAVPKDDKVPEKDVQMEEEAGPEATVAIPSAASGSGLSEGQRRESVDEQNNRDLQRTVKESEMTAMPKKKSRADADKEFTATAPRGSKRHAEEETDEGFGPHGQEVPKSPPRIAPGSPARPTRASKKSAEVEADDSGRME